jgi:hypothetical protein
MSKTTEKRFTNPYEMFETDKSREADGIVLNYSDVFWLKVARAGGSNDHYKRVLTEKLKPFRRAIQTDTIDEAASSRIMREAAAEGLVLNWGTGIYPNGAGTIPGRDGKPMAFNIPNVVQLFIDLPDLFSDVYEQANKASLFRAAEMEADAGNSKKS